MYLGDDHGTCDHLVSALETSIAALNIALEIVLGAANFVQAGNDNAVAFGEGGKGVLKALAHRRENCKRDVSKIGGSNER